MPATSTTIEQSSSPVDEIDMDNVSTEMRSEVPSKRSCSGPRSATAAEVRIAVLQAELTEARAQRDALRDQVRALERTQARLRDMANAAIADRHDGNQQEIIQRYERIIAEKEQAIERSTHATGPPGARRSGLGAVLASVRDSLRNVLTR